MESQLWINLTQNVLWFDSMLKIFMYMFELIQDLLCVA